MRLCFVFAAFAIRAMDAFGTAHPSLSEDGRIMFQNWEHFDEETESGHPDSCVE